MLIPTKFEGYGEGGRLSAQRKYYLDSGEGGSMPTSQNITQTSIPEYARPYVESVLGRAYPMISQPYQQYQGERFAQFSPLQQQVFQAARGLEAAPQVQTASNIAAAASMRGLGPNQYQPTDYQSQSFIQPGTAQSYMSPYMQNVVDTQQREARRQADISNQQMQAQAARAGAFGGSRQAIMQSEANRNLQSQLQGIQAQGLQNAFQQAQQQFNQEQAQRFQGAQLGEQSRQFGAGLGMQGLQTALTGAGQLGQLGTQQFGQNLQALGLQSQLGAQQQQQVQNILNQQYQDWLNYQNYPYKQLGFMSDILRGMPLTQTAQSIYQAPPSAAQSVASLGLGAAGLSRLFADGGAVSMDDMYAMRGEPVLRMAEGGITTPYPESVTDTDSVERILDKLSDDQLKQARQIAMAKRDVSRVQMIDRELAQRASERSGLGAAFNATPMAQEPMQMAGGGIVAFNGEGDEGQVTDSGSAIADAIAALQGAEGDPKRYAQLSAMYGPIVKEMIQFRPTSGMTAEQAKKYEADYLKEMQADSGESPYAAMRKRMGEFEAERAGSQDKAMGLALLRAAGAMAEPGGFVRGAGRAAGAFGESYGEAMKADKAERRALANMEFNLADAERKERMGNKRDARAARERAEKSRVEADTLRFNRLKTIADFTARGMRETKPLRPAGAGKPSTQAEGVAIYAADLKRQYPTMPASEIQARALKMYMEQKGAGLPGVATRTESAEELAARERARKKLLSDPHYQAAQRKGDSAGMAAREREILQQEMATPPRPGAGTGASANTVMRFDAQGNPIQ